MSKATKKQAPKKTKKSKAIDRVVHLLRRERTDFIEALAVPLMERKKFNKLKGGLRILFEHQKARGKTSAPLAIL